MKSNIGRGVVERLPLKSAPLNPSEPKAYGSQYYPAPSPEAIERAQKNSLPRTQADPATIKGAELYENGQAEEQRETDREGQEPANDSEQHASEQDRRPECKGKGGPKQNPDIDLLETIWNSGKPNPKTSERNIEAVKKQFLEHLKSKGVKREERTARWETAYAGFRQRRSRSKSNHHSSLPAGR